MNKFISICVIYHVFYNYVQYVTFGQIFKDLIYEEIRSRDILYLCWQEEMA